jgi:hypothetical protein
VCGYLVGILGNILMFISLGMILLSIGVGITYALVFCMVYADNKGLSAWKKSRPFCLCTYRVIAGLSCLSFRFFRIIFSKLFNRPNFSMQLRNASPLFSATSKLTFASLITNTLPMVAVCVFILYKQSQLDQTFFCALDTLLLGILAGILLTIDSIRSD